MSEVKDLQYISDEEGEIKSVIVPVDLWHEVASEHETQYLLKSDAMKKRIIEARKRKKGIPVEAAFEKLGI